MKDTNGLLQIAIMGMIAVISIMATYIIVDFKTQSIMTQFLDMEYAKVGGKENYEKINKITLEQIQAGLQQYDEGNTGASQENQTPTPTPTLAGTTITVEKAKEVTTNGTYILGNPDADITWVEYSDLECPFCKKLHEAGTIDAVMKKYDGNVNFVFKHFPLDFHKNAQKEAEAAECVGEMAGSEMYYKFIDTIFERTKGNGTGFALSDLGPLAKELGVDETVFQSCLDSGKYELKVLGQMEEGKSFGISGTPGNVLINNKTGAWDKLPGAYPLESFTALIDALLK